MNENLSMAIHAIRQFVYYTMNHDDFSKMCESVWGKGIVANHFCRKLWEYDGNFLKFFVNLDNHNQDVFAKWIIENYHDVDSKKAVEKSWDENVEAQKRILDMFFNECLAFWKREGKDEKEAFRRAIADIPENYPYSPNGPKFNKEVRDEFIKYRKIDLGEE